MVLGCKSSNFSFLLLLLWFSCSFAEHIRVDLALYTASNGNITSLNNRAVEPMAFGGTGYLRAFLSGSDVAHVLGQIGDGHVVDGGIYSSCVHLPNNTTSYSFVVNNERMGCDPSPGRNKRLYIEYRCVADEAPNAPTTEIVSDIYDEGSIVNLDCRRANGIQQAEKGTRIWNGKWFDNFTKVVGLSGGAYALYNLSQIGQSSGEADYTEALQNITASVLEMSQNLTASLQDISDKMVQSHNDTTP